jgi:Outer membrane protein beta-barrel domain
MRRGITTGLLALAVGVLCAPAQARAEAYINPWGGVVFGNDQAETGFRSFGVSFGSAGHGLVGTETNVGLTPGIFGNSVENYLLDIMAGVTIGPTFDSKAGHDVRPFGLIEFGTVRTSIDGIGTGTRMARNDIGVSIGGGATIAVNDRVGVRGDVRYFRTVRGEDAANSLNVSLANFHYWRTAIGITLH